MATKPQWTPKLVNGTLTANEMNTIVDAVRNHADEIDLLNANITVSPNLFNKLTAVANSFANHQSGVIQGNYNGFSASALIPVNGNTQYMSNAEPNYIAYLDANNTFISGLSSFSWPITTPTNATFVRITLASFLIEQIQFVQGTTLPPYKPFGKLSLLPSAIIPTTTKKIAFVGDSITGLDTWCQQVATNLNFTKVNLGISGTAISGGNNSSNAMWSDVRVNAIPLDTDIVVLLGGTNDWAQGKIIGSINSIDTAEFIGALNTWLNKVLPLFPTKRIFLATTTFGLLPALFSDGKTNSIGLTTNDYAEAIRNVAKNRNIPLIDFNINCGWNEKNIASYINNDGGLLHPNLTGSVRMGIVATKAIKDNY